jgi:hypothetical protein
MTKQDEFYEAIENKNTEKVALLLKDSNVNPAANDNWAIGSASYDGSFKIVKLLLNDPRVDPSDYDNYAFRQSVKNTHIRIFKLLLNDPRVDPSDSNNNAIRLSFYDIPESLFGYKPNFTYKKKAYILNQLWKNKNVKNTIQNNQLKIYNQLIKKELQHKIDGF